MRNIFIITKYTFIEVYRSKVMSSIAFLALSLLMITYVASEFAYGAPSKIALDFGFGITAISNYVMAIFIGASLLAKEIEQKTLYMVLSRTISRTEFLVGKIIGLSVVLGINSLVLSGLSISMHIILGGSFSTLMLWAGIFSFYEAFILLLFAVFFSLLTNSTMSIIYSIGTFVVGHALNETSKIFFVKANYYFKSVISFSFFIVPNLYKLNLKDFLIYRQNLNYDYIFGISLYAVLYSIALLLVVVFIFKNKNLD